MSNKYSMPYIQMSKYFDTRNGDNLACSCCGEFILDAVTIRHYQMMDEFREWFGRSMAINSGHRCVKYNATLDGSASDSRHIRGDANDVKLPADFFKLSIARQREYLKNIRKKWFEICDKYGVAGGSGFYNGFFHLDSRPQDRAVWDKSKYFKAA